MQDYLRPKIVKCAVCENEFDAGKRNRGKGIHRYCSKRCRQVADNRRHYRRNNPPKTEQELTRICVVCSISFVTDPHHPEALACSVKCNEARMNAKRRRDTINKQAAVTKECEECGAVFTPNRRALKRTKYCSKKCGLRVASRVFRERQASRVTASSRRYGTPAWQQAKAKILERDSRVCRVCGKDRKHLHVHHLFHRTDDEKNDHAVDGLVAVCNSCHSKMHDICLGKDGDDYVVSGLVFDWLGIEKVRIMKQEQK